jgi:hypothetical protein
MTPTESAPPPPVCLRCDVAVERCAFCERVDCAEAICYRCLRIQFRQLLAHPHPHGG